MKRICAAALLMLPRLAFGADCGKCHAAEAKAHSATSMARALERVEDGAILKANPKLTFQNGPYTYTIVREGSRSIYSVTDGVQTVTAPIAWAFGLGAAGQTYVIERGGVRYESRVSFYKRTGGLDLTMGATQAKPKNIDEAAGRFMTPKDDVLCFGCHSAGGVTNGKLQFETMRPGVQCVNCHAGADRHEAAMKAGDAKSGALPKLAKLNAEESSELCGKCHRTWSDIASNGPRGLANVRFQPYRLANSKCYDAFDSRIACTACHDPHNEVSRSVTGYDSKCTACHSQKRSQAAQAKTARGCPTGKTGCAGCHMPKYEIPGSHHEFSDHQIRIVRPHEAYPN